MRTTQRWGGTFDVEYLFPWGWDELEGVANRTDFDLKAHIERSGEDLSYFDPETNERFVPYVIEPAAGATRTTFAFLLDAYTEEEVNGEKRAVLKLDPRLAPIKAAVLPLSKKPDLVEATERVASQLRSRWAIEVDVTQSIGRRYRRQDEIGTPFCITVDFDSLDDDQVTVRDRDTMAQDRIPDCQRRGVPGRAAPVLGARRRDQTGGTRPSKKVASTTIVRLRPGATLRMSDSSWPRWSDERALTVRIRSNSPVEA